MTQVERILHEENERRLARPFKSLPGDERGGRAPVKLPEADAAQIRELRAQGLKFRAIAKQLNVSISTVSRVLQEKP